MVPDEENKDYIALVAAALAEVVDHSGEQKNGLENAGLLPRKRVRQSSARRCGSPPSRRRYVHASYQWPLQARSGWSGKLLPTGHDADGSDVLCPRRRDDSHLAAQ
eukprot:4104582-Pyramimonas_sp.AAC.1